MSGIEETPRPGPPSRKDTRGGSQPRVGGVHLVPALPDEVLAQLRTRALVQPRGPRPGQSWTPRTDAESHLLGEARRLDRARQLLLGEVGRLRHLLGIRRTSGQEQREQVARTAAQVSGCPLGVSQINVLIGAARGELPEETAARLHLSPTTVKSTRVRAVRRLEARTVAHAVALAVAAGWITLEQFGGGEGQ